LGRIEEERLWLTTWQLACTLDHVSEPGDVHVHDVGLLSKPGSYSFGLVLDQDETNLARAQRGPHAPGLTHLTLSGEEWRIINLHRNLDRVTGCDSGLELSYVD